jgi:hypothetical protein
VRKTTTTLVLAESPWNNTIWRARRLLVPLFVVLLLMGSTVVAGERAWACSSSSGDHCYGLATWAKSAHGAQATIRVSCIWSPDGGGTGFITDELWVLGNGGWIEQGMIYGNTYNSRYWFWADNRPDWPFSYHPEFALSDSLNTDYKATITHEGTGSSTWFLDRNGVWIGTSTDNFTSATTRMDTGSETTRNTSRTDSVSKVMEWQGAAGNWNTGWEDGLFHADKSTDADYSAHWNIPYSKLSYSVHHSQC